MEINLKVLGKQQVESTTPRKKMSLSAESASMVFQLFTKNVYSNPEGTVVREITSNCFDSHVEAGVNHPVLIKKTFDEQTETTYISFIDYGVGMSPERVDSIYTVYFESTKRTNNNEIGGFGIGGKTPLAYKRYTGEGEGEYDNSFYVITNYNGTKYYYNIYEGAESPEYSLFHEEKTTERNGTEIRIPVLEKDIHKFEHELLKQLYYFEGIVFEGFSNRVENDFQIIRGKSFLYRGTNLDDNIHVCLGRVYYPINYDKLGLNQYNYNIPVAINVPIGEINVTVSREQLEYSEKTIKFLKKKLVEVVDELKMLLSKQYSHVVSLEDYFKFENNFGYLYLTDEKSVKLSGMIKKSDVDLTGFRYADLKEVSSSTLFELFFNVHTYGKKENKKSHNHDGFQTFNKDYSDLGKVHTLYYAPDYDSYTLKRIKQSYLKSKHGRFYLIVPKKLEGMQRKICDAFDIHFDTHDIFLKSNELKLITQMQNEYFELVKNNATEYEPVEIPEDFKENYGKPKLPKEMLKETVPMFLGRYSKTRVKVEHLVNFRGKIFYGTTEDERQIREAHDVFVSLFGGKHVADSYYTYSGGYFEGGKNGIMFASVAKNNIKYFQYCKNAYPISMFYHKVARRKVDDMITQMRNSDVRDMYSSLSSIYKNYDLFSLINPTWATKVQVVKDYITNLGDKNRTLLDTMYYFKRYVKFDMNDLTDEEKEVREILNGIKEIEEKNEKVLHYINLPDGWSVVDKKTDEKMIPYILRTVMTF